MFNGWLNRFLGSNMGELVGGDLLRVAIRLKPDRASIQLDEIIRIMWEPVGMVSSIVWAHVFNVLGVVSFNITFSWPLGPEHMLIS